MFNDAVKKCPWSLIYVPRCYKRLKEMWYEYCPHVWALALRLYDKLITWYNSYKKLSVLKKHIDRSCYIIPGTPLDTGIGVC